jgi:hypothetical protein
MHYKTDYTKLDLDLVERFLREMGVSDIEELEELDSLKVTAKSSLPEQTQVMVLAVKE